MAGQISCYMCDSARTNEELTDDNDLSCISVGRMEKGYRMMLCAGDGKPLRLEVETWIDGQWHVIGVYNPPYCPNCGMKQE